MLPCISRWWPIAAKACLWDIDGNEYIDLNMAYGPLLFGHRPKHVIDAVVKRMSKRAG